MALATGIVAAVMAGLLAVLDFAGFDLDTRRDAFVALVAVGGAGGLVYLLVTLLLGCEEPRALLSRAKALLPGART
jgi:hypothetical protein